MTPEGLTVWSLGSILYILLTGCWEFENGGLRRDFMSERHLSHSALSVINSVLCPFAPKRATLDSILSSKYVDKFFNDYIVRKLSFYTGIVFIDQN